jgi:hypothetical protein
MPAKLIKLECRIIKGDNDNIYLDYKQHDEGSDKPNHSHRTIVSKKELRYMLHRMEQHLEDPQDWAIFDEVRQNKAVIDFAETMRQHRLKEENKQQEEESWKVLKRKQNGAVAGLVGIEGGVVSGVINLESSGVEAPDWRPRHDKQYHEA